MRTRNVRMCYPLWNELLIKTEEEGFEPPSELPR